MGAPRDAALSAAAAATATLDDVLAAALRAGALHVDLHPDGLKRIVLPLLTLAAVHARAQAPVRTSHQPEHRQPADVIGPDLSAVDSDAAPSGTTTGAGEAPLPPGLAATINNQSGQDVNQQTSSTAAPQGVQRFRCSAFGDAAQQSEDKHGQRTLKNKAHSQRRAREWQAKAQASRVPPTGAPGGAVGWSDGGGGATLGEAAVFRHAQAARARSRELVQRRLSSPPRLRSAGSSGEGGADEREGGEHIDLAMSAIEAAADCWASALAAYQTAAAAPPLPADTDTVMLRTTENEAPTEWYEGALGVEALELLCGKRQRDEAVQPGPEARGSTIGTTPADHPAAASEWAATVRGWAGAMTAHAAHGGHEEGRSAAREDVRRALEPSFRTPPPSPTRSRTPGPTPSKIPPGWTALGSPRGERARAGGGGGRGGAMRLHVATVCCLGLLVPSLASSFAAVAPMPTTATHFSPSAAVVPTAHPSLPLAPSMLIPMVFHSPPAVTPSGGIFTRIAAAATSVCGEAVRSISSRTAPLASADPDLRRRYRVKLGAPIPSTSLIQQNRLADCRPAPPNLTRVRRWHISWAAVSGRESSSDSGSDSSSDSSSDSGSARDDIELNTYHRGRLRAVQHCSPSFSRLLYVCSDVVAMRCGPVSE